MSDDLVGFAQHTLIQEKTERWILRVIADGHCRDDFMAVQIDGQGTLLDHPDRQP